MRLKKIEKTRLRRLRRQDWEDEIEKTRLRRQDWEDKIEKTRLRRQDWEERLKGLKKQDWIDWEERFKNVFINPINLLQSSSIYINLKNIINWVSVNYKI